MSQLTDTLKYLIEGILPKKTKITIESNIVDGQEIVDLSAPKEIIGQIIGKEGKIIKSLRTLLNIAHPEARFHLNIKE